MNGGGLMKTGNGQTAKNNTSAGWISLFLVFTEVDLWTGHY
jgi:hypothetical protein